ncbi:MAG: hypothetical protein ABSF75_05240 [Terracidiphilus sp.]
MAGFTAERDMGTEGAGSADTAVRDAINQGIIPGPRLRISGNAIDILGGHEDAIHFNPAQHVLSNADYANSADQIVAVIREQHKEGRLRRQAGWARLLAFTRWASLARFTRPRPESPPSTTLPNSATKPCG